MEMSAGQVTGEERHAAVPAAPRVRRKGTSHAGRDTRNLSSCEKRRVTGGAERGEGGRTGGRLSEGRRGGGWRGGPARTAAMGCHAWRGLGCRGCPS
eukprot:763857-Hanusia_phi.AAC.6